MGVCIVVVKVAPIDCGAACPVRIATQGLGLIGHS